MAEVPQVRSGDAARPVTGEASDEAKAEWAESFRSSITDILGSSPF